jgi:hypothetical protein
MVAFAQQPLCKTAKATPVALMHRTRQVRVAGRGVMLKPRSDDIHSVL